MPGRSKASSVSKTSRTTYTGFFQEHGGIINLKATQAAMYNVAGNSGQVDFHEYETVTGIEPRENGCVVVTTEGADGAHVYQADRLAITTGPYVNEVLAHLDLSLNLDIWEMSSAYYRKKDPHINFPTWFVFQKPQSTSLFYGFPEVQWAHPGYIRVAPDIPDSILSDPSQRSGKPSGKSLALNSEWVETSHGGPGRQAAVHRDLPHRPQQQRQGAALGLSPGSDAGGTGKSSSTPPAGPPSSSRYWAKCSSSSWRRTASFSSSASTKSTARTSTSSGRNDGTFADWTGARNPGTEVQSMQPALTVNREIPPMKIYPEELTTSTGFPKAPGIEVAIIGAGVSGLYSAYRLTHDAHSPLDAGQVQIFEMSRRIGGRLESVVLPGMEISGELGGMRYMTSQEIVTTLIEKVFSDELVNIPFSMGEDAHHFGYFRKQRMRMSAWNESQAKGEKFAARYYLNEADEGYSADQLFNKIVYDVLHADPWFMKTYGDKIKNPSPFKYEFKLTRKDWNCIKPQLVYHFEGPYKGRKANDLGFWNLIKDQVSEEGYTFLADAGGYFSNTINWNAAEAFPYMVGDFSDSANDYNID